MICNDKICKVSPVSSGPRWSDIRNQEDAGSLTEFDDVYHME